MKKKEAPQAAKKRGKMRPKMAFWARPSASLGRHVAWGAVRRLARAAKHRLKVVTPHSSCRADALITVRRDQYRSGCLTSCRSWLPWIQGYSGPDQSQPTYLTA